MKKPTYNFNILSNKIFGSLRVSAHYEKRGRRTYWQTVCVCGSEKWVRSDHLVTGKTISCGCIKKVIFADDERGTHMTWTKMKDRISNRNHTHYKQYGGRGIKICERWLDFRNFFEDMGPRPKGLSIERIDNDDDYRPGNCRWANAKEQNRNKSNGTQVTYKDKTQSITEWAEELGMNRSTLYSRWYRGDSPETFLK